MSTFDEAHSAVSVGIAECYLTQPPDMTWEDRCDQLATAAIEAMQLFIQGERDSSAPQMIDANGNWKTSFGDVG